MVEAVQEVSPGREEHQYPIPFRTLQMSLLVSSVSAHLKATRAEVSNDRETMLRDDMSPFSGSSQRGVEQLRAGSSDNEPAP